MLKHLIFHEENYAHISNNERVLSYVRKQQNFRAL